MPFTFHGLRHTCITHWVVAGRDQLFLLTAGGHTDVEMTRRYLAAAASLSAKFGKPHPPLPEELLGESGQALGQVPEATKAKSGTLKDSAQFSQSLCDPSGNRRRQKCTMHGH